MNKMHIDSLPQVSLDLRERIDKQALLLRPEGINQEQYNRDSILDKRVADGLRVADVECQRRGAEGAYRGRLRFGAHKGENGLVRVRWQRGRRGCQVCEETSAQVARYAGEEDGV